LNRAQAGLKAATLAYCLYRFPQVIEGALYLVSLAGAKLLTGAPEFRGASPRLVNRILDLGAIEAADCVYNGSEVRLKLLEVGAERLLRVFLLVAARED
jgi:hypothetical protein